MKKNIQETFWTKMWWKCFKNLESISLQLTIVEYEVHFDKYAQNRQQIKRKKEIKSSNTGLFESKG